MQAACLTFGQHMYNISWPEQLLCGVQGTLELHDRQPSVIAGTHGHCQGKELMPVHSPYNVSE